MDDRIKRLSDKALSGNGSFICNDSHIKPLLRAADDEEKFRIIRREYSRIIETDGDSLLCTQYPCTEFCERVEVDYEQIWSNPPPWHRDMSSYAGTVFIDGGNHYCSDFETVLRLGISGLLDRICEMKNSAADSETEEFCHDLWYTANAVTAWVMAHYDALSLAAERETSEKRRSELLEMAAVCARVPFYPATTFREALQCYLFVFILFPDGLGCIDRYLYPYYAADIERGILTRDEALCLTEELFIKIFSRFGPDEPRSGNNHGVVGGYTCTGECGHNEYTSVVLEALTDPPTWRPQISYRITKKTTDEQFMEAMEAHLKRPDLVTFLNDDVIVPGLVGLGVSYEDAVSYSSSGCNETILSGCSQPGALEGLFNIMHSFECFMKDVPQLGHICDFDSFYKSYERYLQADLDLILRQSYQRDETDSRCPSSLQSLLTRGCISSASHVSCGGAKYNFCTWGITGLINLADSLNVIRQMVFDERRFTLTELCGFLEANWEGYEGTRSYILKCGRYFGNDHDDADLLVNRICRSVNEYTGTHTPYRGGRYLFGTLTGYELSHIVFGEVTGASPDGRYASDPFAPSVASFPGADKNGLTAYLKSAAKLDGEQLRSSVVVNLKLDRAMVDSKDKVERLCAALRTYFALGGIQLQINYLSADELLCAQREPDKYRGLRVRVTGFSGFFTSFDKSLQDEIIDRFLHTV